ncbi:MAG: hypothetical protein ACI8PZ_004363 [Myxococcota bacterium]|jgi:hypothetical protein
MLPLVAALACGAPTPDARTAPASVDVGQSLAAPPLRTLAGEPVPIPDPAGRHVVLELIRSADW